MGDVNSSLYHGAVGVSTGDLNSDMPNNTGCKTSNNWYILVTRIKIAVLGIGKALI
jgi:hypothetical protein